MSDKHNINSTVVPGWHCLVGRPGSRVVRHEEGPERREVHHASLVVQQSETDNNVNNVVIKMSKYKLIQGKWVNVTQ